MHARWRWIGFRLVAVVLATCVGLLASELALRLVGVGHGGVYTVDAEQFASLPGVFEPNHGVTIREIPELPYWVSIDSLGYRGNELAREKARGEIRILFAGDSFTFGTYVDDEETLPWRLEEALRRHCRAPVRVVNAGLGGSTIPDQIQMIRRGLPLDPDLVVLQFTENDISDLAGTPLWEQLEVNRQAKSGFPLSLVYPWARKTALWQVILRARAIARNRREGVRSEDESGASGPTAQEVERLRARYAAELETLRDELFAAGVPLLYVVYPSHLSVYDLWDSDQLAWISGVSWGLAIPTVRLLPALVADGRPDTVLYQLPYDGHPAPEGYEVAAAFLADSVAARLPAAAACR